MPLIDHSANLRGISKQPALHPYWLSWWLTEETGDFDLDWPWWVSGTRASDDAEAVCAAVRASSAMAAMEIVMQAHDVRPSKLEVRFCEVQPEDWTPFTSRFQKAEWMRWESPAPC